MKTAVWYNNKDIRIEDVPRPKPGPKEMLVRVMACGICGSDIVEWYRLPRAPLVPGHELGGDVVEVGEAVAEYKPGDRVFIAPKVPCMDCDYCRQGHFPVCSNVSDRLPGGFAEYIVVPEALMEHGTYLLPEAVSHDQATFIEPLACVVRAQRLGGVEHDRTLMVMGCGMSGLLHVKLGKAAGCRVIATDINRKRLDVAEGLGADLAMDAADDVAGRLVETNGKKADIVMLCTSAMPAIEQAWESVDKGGAIVFFAVPGPEKQVVIPINAFWTNEIRILTSYYCGPPDISEAIRLMETGAVTVDDMVTHKLPLEDTCEGFRLVSDGRESIKVIINPCHKENQ